MHYVLLPDGRWLLIGPGQFVAFMAGACLFGYGVGSLVRPWVPRRRLKPKRRKRGVWS